MMTSIDHTTSIPLEITVRADAIDRFTILFQSGIMLTVNSGVPVGVFMSSLPGFDIDYISDTVQTIFLDGNAIDDLEQPLTRQDHVLALSAAMPGLAGAIFRRNSLCAALRTRSDNPRTSEKSNHELCILLKLFNTIALEKGGEILRSGGIISGENLLSFFQQRPSLLESVNSFTIDGNIQEGDILVPTLFKEKQYFLQINTAG
jgi:hypothetical protein